MDRLLTPHPFYPDRCQGRPIGLLILWLTQHGCRDKDAHSKIKKRLTRRTQFENRDAARKRFTEWALTTHPEYMQVLRAEDGGDLRTEHHISP